MMQQIHFDDGAAYERFMGQWSQLVGDEFMVWLAAPSGLRWLDVGCGNGAFTERLCERCAPASIAGIDPSEAQLAFARTRPSLRTADLRRADAMALPFPDSTFDAAVMPLVIFFVPDPATGVSEMVRVVRPGGFVAAYGWDMEGGGFPYAALHDAMRASGMVVPAPPHPEASGLDALATYWTHAGLEEVQTRTITVQRTYADFDDYWATILCGPSVGASLAAAPREEIALVRKEIQLRLLADSAGRITVAARANAVTGRVPRGLLAH